MKPLLVDTHSHAHFRAFRGSEKEVIRRSLDAGVWMNLVGTQKDTSKAAITFAEQFDAGVYATIGLHPTHLHSTHIDEDEVEMQTREETFDIAFYRELAKSKKVVAIGEMGLEYYRLADVVQQKGITEDEIKQKQQEVFRQAVELAAELDLPIIIHCRDAHEDAQAIIREAQAKHGAKVRGVVHCYTSDWERARPYLEELGFMISFTGIITFEIKKSSRDATEALLDVVRKAPLDRIMVETDCPYLSPAPHRGERNEPSYVRFVAEKVATLKDISFDEVAKQTTENAFTLFRYSNLGKNA